MFYSNYLRLCNKINKSPSAVGEALGFSRASVTGWSKGALPRKAALQAIADYFHITVDELMEGVDGAHPTQDAKKDPAQKGEVEALAADLPENIRQLIRICMDRPDLARALLSVAQQIENEPSDRG